MGEMIVVSLGLMMMEMEASTNSERKTAEDAKDDVINLKNITSKLFHANFQTFLTCKFI